MVHDGLLPISNQQLTLLAGQALQGMLFLWNIVKLKYKENILDMIEAAKL